MPTFQNLTDRIKNNLYGYASKQQQWTYLSNSIQATDLTFTVADAKQVSRGLVELGGQELVLVSSVNRNTNTITVEPGGRGFAGSTAQAWPANTTVENNPIFPWVRIKETANDVINELYPDLFAVGVSKFPKVSVQFQYQLPADCEEVINVQYQLIGPSKIYPWARNWRYNNTADTTDFPNGKAIVLLEDVTPGREILVNYMKEPSVLVNTTDDFATVTGLPASAADLVFYGAMVKMVPSLAGPRLILDTVESSERASFVQPQNVAQISQYWNTLYTNRLLKESKKLYDRYKRPLHYEEQ